VEMEAAARFTVDQYRGVDLAAAFVISDHLLAEDRWTHAFGTPCSAKTQSGYSTLPSTRSADKSLASDNSRFGARASGSPTCRIRRLARPAQGRPAKAGRA
jgi:hypothetical protein